MPKQTILKLKNYFKGNQSSTKRKTTTYQKVEKIGILIQAKEIKNSSAINTFVNGLKSEGKNITVLCFNEKGSNLYFDFNLEQISLKDISYTGKFLNPVIKHFIAQSFDYLICLTISPSPVLVALIVASKAKCKAGLQTPSNESLFDLMVHTTKEDFKPEEIGEQIIALAKKIKTND
jgi:hypothetical protein